jgi:Fur family transcriptional regulator, ferric uptake regulator
MKRKDRPLPSRRAPKTAPGALAEKLAELQVQGRIRMTGQRRVIAQVIAEATDHPSVEEIHRRAVARDAKLSMATVYRTIRMLEQAKVLERHDFGDGRARYEQAPRVHHDHLVDLESGRVIEFHDDEIEALQEKIARRLGYRLVGHRLELFAIPVKPPGPARRR